MFDPTPDLPDDTLVRAIAKGRRWRDEIISGSVTEAEQIALREQCSVRHVNMTISLAFLAPDVCTENPICVDEVTESRKLVG